MTEHGDTSVVDRVARAGALAALAFATLVAAPRDARADAYKDEKLGFSLSSPSKWKQMPVATNERWVVAKFQSHREWEFADKTNNWWTRHTPFLDVVVIPLPDETPRTAEEGKDERTRPVAPEYSDLKTYLDKTLQKGGDEGFYFDKEDEAQVGGMKVIQYVLNFEKNVRAPKRVYAWAYYTADAIYGLIGDSLVQFEDKVKPDLLAAFRSFKAFPRTGKLPGDEPPADDADAAKDGGKNLTDAELKVRRDKLVTDTLQKIKSNLPDGWTTKDSEHFTAVSHSDSKYTARVLEHAEAVRGWLDDNMGYIGSGYCGRAIIRICQDRDEEMAFDKTRVWSPEHLEIVTYKDKEGWSDWATEQVNRGVLGVWSRDKNQDLVRLLPTWLQWGFWDTVATAVSKGKQIEFRPSTWDRVRMMQLRRDKKLLEAKSFFSMTDEQLRSGENGENMYQADAFTRFLMIGSGSKNPKYKNVLADYIKALAVLIDEARAARRKEKVADERAPLNEQEEAAMIQAQQRAWREKEQETLQKLMDKTFPNWDEKEWDKLSACYWKEIGV